MRQFLLALFLAFFGLAPVGEAWAEASPVTGEAQVLLAQKKKKKKKRKKKKKKKKKKKRKKKRKKKKKKKRKSKKKKKKKKPVDPAEDTGAEPAAPDAEGEAPKEAADKAAKPAAKTEKGAPPAAAQPASAAEATAATDAVPAVSKGWWASRSQNGKYVVLGGSGGSVLGLALAGMGTMLANDAVSQRNSLQQKPIWEDQDRTDFRDLYNTRQTWAMIRTVGLGLSAVSALATAVGSFL